jgi:transposase
VAAERLSMRCVKEVLRQKWVLKKSNREVARSIAISAGYVSGVMTRAAAKGLDNWAAVSLLTEDELEERLYGPKVAAGASRPLPDPAHIHAERQRPGVTLELLHLEYLEANPDGYRYTAFCNHYRRWLKKRRLSMRQVHLGGEKIFVDYSGKRPAIVDPNTGEVIAVELFVAVLGASSATYAEATMSQRSTDFIQSHVRAFEYFGGVPKALVPDQLKSGVTDAHRYEPGVQRTYEEMARHYGTAVLPARPAKPKDKAKVERAVQIAQRWILARLRNETFFTLTALNERIGELLEDLNARKMRVYGASRNELFERLEKNALLPLPQERFTYAEWKAVRVSRLDYHVEIDGHFYSAPHTLVAEEAKVEARITATTVELYRNGERFTSHLRNYQRGRHTTKPEHMPKAHQKHLEWTPERITHWAASIGPKTKELVGAILADRPHPEMGYRSCLGILRLGKKYPDRLEAACARALVGGARSYKSVASILENGLDRQPLPLVSEPKSQVAIGVHGNVRGRDYYH